MDQCWDSVPSSFVYSNNCSDGESIFVTSLIIPFNYFCQFQNYDQPFQDSPILGPNLQSVDFHTGKSGMVPHIHRAIQNPFSNESRFHVWPAIWNNGPYDHFIWTSWQKRHVLWKSAVILCRIFRGQKSLPQLWGRSLWLCQWKCSLTCSSLWACCSYCCCNDHLLNRKIWYLSQE